MSGPTESWTFCEMWILLTIFATYLQASVGLDSRQTSYMVSGDQNSSHTHHRHRHHNRHRSSVARMEVYQEPDPVDSLKLVWINSTTDSISINWTLNESYNISGFVHSSVVEYITSGGRFTSDPLSSKMQEYTVDNLSPGSIYTVCVYMTEVYGIGNFSTKLHSRCVKINTIDYIRKDSVLVCMISTGYYAFMTLLGYTQWKRKIWSIEKKMKNKKDVDSNIDSTNCVMRWRELAEKDSLMQVSPGCSIETEYR